MNIDTAVLVIPGARNDAGFESRWYAAEVAGLPLLVRTLFLLQSRHILRVHILASESELPELTVLLSRWKTDRRLPRVETQAPEGPDTGALPPLYLLIDGARVIHPMLIDFAREQRTRAALATEEGGPAGIGVLSGEERPSLSTLCVLPQILAPKGLFSRPARNRTERHDVEGLVFRSLRRETDGWVASRLNRPVSLFLSRRLIRIPLHPNGFTLVTFLVGLGSGALAARGSPLSMAAAGVLYQLASVLDGVDGEVARAKFLTSRAGGWLDTICDEATNLAFLIGVIIGIRRMHYPGILLSLGTAALALYILTLLLLYGQLVFRLRSSSLLAFQEEIGRPEFRGRKMARFVLFLQPLIKRDLYAFLFMVLCLAGFPGLIVVLWLVAVALTPVLYAAVVHRFLRSPLS